jgi:hypothetical protein
MSESIAAASRDLAPWREHLIRRYFLCMSVAMLAILTLGFAPTLLLRPLFDVPPIPLYLIVHGAVLFAGFIWFLVQSALPAGSRTPATLAALGLTPIAAPFIAYVLFSVVAPK